MYCILGNISYIEQIQIPVPFRLKELFFYKLNLILVCIWRDLIAQSSLKVFSNKINLLKIQLGPVGIKTRILYILLWDTNPA